MNCVRDISAKKEINSVKHTKLHRFIQKQCSVLVAGWLTDGAVNEPMRQFAALRDDCTLQLLD